MIKLVQAFLALWLVGCQEYSEIYTSNCNSDNVISQGTKSYARDSGLLNFVVQRWIDSSYGSFSRYSKRNAPNGHVAIHIGQIFCDTQRLKLTAFVYVQYSSDYLAEFDKGVSHPDTLFDSHTIMGTRQSNTQVWNLAELNEVFIGLRASSLKSIVTQHESVFLNKFEMKGRTVAIFDGNTQQNTMLKPVGFVPCEDSFWTESPLWRKGERTPGYYLFQTYMNSTPKKINLRQTPNVQLDSFVSKYAF